MAARALRWIAAVVALEACAPTLSPAWREAMASADRARHAGRHAEAAAGYDQAAREASRPLDRDEAEYRAAVELARAGDRAGALERFDRVAERSRDFERGARAAWEAAVLRCEGPSGEAQTRGWRDLDTLVRTRSATGPARLAAMRTLHALDARDASLTRTLAWIDEVLADVRLDDASLRATLRAEGALRLSRAGRTAEAVAAWRALFVDARHPRNPRWDDGHLELARLLRTSGDARGAVAALDEMLSVVDASCTGGTCNAPDAQEGAMLRGEVLRDDLHDAARAAEAYRWTYEMFPTSRVRDDALEGEALAREALADGSACAVWTRLAREFPCTRRGRAGRARALACGGSPEAPRDGACE